MLRLTRREIEIIIFLHEGLEYRQIAERCICPRITYATTSRTLRQTGARNRAIQLKTDLRFRMSESRTNKRRRPIDTTLPHDILTPASSWGWGRRNVTAKLRRALQRGGRGVVV